MTDLSSVPWRTGRTLGRTVYARTGGDDWKADTAIGMMDTPELAEEACAAHNAALIRAKDGDTGFGTVGEDGRLTSHAGHELWRMSVYLPQGREAEVIAWMTAHGLEVYRADRVSDMMRATHGR